MKITKLITATVTAYSLLVASCKHVRNASDISEADNNAKPAIILVHGTQFDGRDSEGNLYADVDVSMKYLFDFFSANGFKDLILMPTYDSNRNWEGIRTELAPQILDFMKKFAPSQRFIIIGHSLGHFAALYTIVKTIDPMTAGTTNPDFISSRFDLLVGLGGIAHGFNGWNTEAWMPFYDNGIANKVTKLLAPNMVKSAADDDLQPYMPEQPTPDMPDNPKLRQFYEGSAAQIARLPTCSLYSPFDRVVMSNENEDLAADKHVTPGKLSGSWVKVPPEILPEVKPSRFPSKADAISVLTKTHMDFIRNPDVFRFMVKSCNLRMP